MFRMLGKKVELYRYKIIYTEDDEEIIEYCISEEHKNEIEQTLKNKNMSSATTQINQTGNEWINGLEFDSYDKALEAFNLGKEWYLDNKPIKQNELKSILKAVRKLVRVDELTEEELKEMVELYENYKVDYEYMIDDVFKLDGKLYKVIQAHTSQENWIPKELSALYLELMPENVIPQWVQPSGSHDAYKLGDKVIYNGEIWQSKIDANTTVPDGDEPHNRYWERV